MNNMNTIEQLVPVFNTKIGEHTVQVCDARALHAYLGSKQDFSTWIKSRITKYSFEENLDYVQLIDCSAPQNNGALKSTSYGAGKIDYHLTLDMAKELAMVENNPKGREVRRYFIAMEKQALVAVNAQPCVTNLVVTARAWADMAQIQADMAKTQADIAQAHADKARAWADDYERGAATNTSQSPPTPQPQPQSLIPPREIAFIQAWWDCLGSQTVTASDLYRAVATKQCQELNDKSSALLGDISQWTPKKLSHALRRWSQTILNGYAVQNIGRTSHGILWRLQLLLT